MKKRVTDFDSQFQSQFDNEGVHEVTLYADNEMYLKELRICVSAHDWYLLKEQPCFQELIEFVHSLQISEERKRQEGQRKKYNRNNIHSNREGW